MPLLSDDPSSALAPGAPGARRRFWRGLLLLALLLAAVQLLRPHDVLPGVAGFVRGIGWIGPVVFGLLYLPAALAAVPLAVLTFTAGWLFGPVVATLIAVPGCTMGACAAFAVGRFMAGDPRFLERGEGRVARVARALETRRGFWAVVLLRLAPFSPFAVLNFAFGATPIRFSTYALATLVGSVPATVGFAVTGAVLGQR